MTVRVVDRLQRSAEQVKLVLAVRACCAAKELLQLILLRQERG
jgi:hypothetical protein